MKKALIFLLIFSIILPGTFTYGEEVEEKNEITISIAGDVAMDGSVRTQVKSNRGDRYFRLNLKQKVRP